MKVIWEESDIKPGVRLQKPDCGVTGSHIVGVRADVFVLGGNSQYSVLISIADGQVSSPYTKQGLVDVLNDDGCYMPVELAKDQWDKWS